MKNTKQHFSTGLESFEEGGSVTADHTDQVATAGEIEVNRVIRKNANYIDAIEGAEIDVASLESLLEAIKDCRDVGMESWSAHFVRIHVGVVQKRYRIDGLSTAIPALECFNGRQSRMATSVSVESVTETIVKVKAWIADMRLSMAA